MKKSITTALLFLAVMFVYAQTNSPLCFTAKNGNVNVKFSIRNVTHTIQYSVDSADWYTYPTDSTIALTAGGKIYFRADSNQTTATAFGGFDDCSSFSFTSSNNGTVEASGNIMSLYGPDCPDLALQTYAFKEMFSGCNILTTAPALPATKLEAHCYECMFKKCSSLKSAPALPATSLASYCYFEMFIKCTSLTDAPALPADTLSNYCYGNMFEQCTSLKTAPALPATTLANNCYYGMFGWCKALTTAPALPATKLNNECYRGMFQECSALATAPELPATAMEYYCYCSMFDGCTSLAAAPVLAASSLAHSCYHSMFDGCTALKSIPALPATTLKEYCYYHMFRGCSSLTLNTAGPGSQWSIPATATSTNSLEEMFTGTAGTMNGTPELNTTYYLTSGAISDVINVAESAYIVYSDINHIFVNGAAGQEVRVYDVNGRMIAEAVAADETEEIAVPAAGIYVVCVANRESHKVIVK